MAKKPAQVAVVSKQDPKRDRTMKNRQVRLERHLKKFPQDKVAQAALKHEKPARKASKAKGSFPKAVIRIIECLPRATGKTDKATGKPIMKNGSGFVSSKHRVGSLLYFGSQEPVMVDSTDKNGRPQFIVNPNAQQAWRDFIDASKRNSQRKRRG